MRRSTREKILPAVKVILVPVAIICIVMVFFTAMNNLNSNQTDEGKDQLETSIRRACAACYAVEGFYPPSLDYIQEHYGVLVDSKNYNVFYDVFSENLMPDITVIQKY